eukprot:EG_transcript_50713
MHPFPQLICTSVDGKLHFQISFRKKTTPLHQLTSLSRTPRESVWLSPRSRATVGQASKPNDPADPPSSSTSRGWASFLTGVGASPLFYVSIGALAAAAAVKGSA